MFSYSHKYTWLSVLVFQLLYGCGSTPMETPEAIGAKKRTGIRTGADARETIDQLHGLEVSADDNLIADYGDDKKDLLYISYYEHEEQAQEALELMTQKMAHAKGGPFFHVMPIKNYAKEAFITLGMGATHYIFISGHFLIWLQTYQTFGPTIPGELTKLYPVMSVK